MLTKDLMCANWKGVETVRRRVDIVVRISLIVTLHRCCILNFFLFVWRASWISWKRNVKKFIHWSCNNKISHRDSEPQNKIHNYFKYRYELLKTSLICKSPPCDVTIDWKTELWLVVHVSCDCWNETSLVSLAVCAPMTRA